MSVEHLASIIKGEPESLMALEAVHADTQHTPSRFVVSLKRAQTITIQLPNGAGASLGYINPNNIPVPEPLGLSEPQMAVLKRTAYREWSSVTNGIRTSDLVRAVGEPLSIRLGLDNGQSRWEYGCVERIGGKTIELAPVELTITNGGVAMISMTIPPPNDTYTLEVLSRPSTKPNGVAKPNGLKPGVNR
jgi:hypothetical protein